MAKILKVIALLTLLNLTLIVRAGAQTVTVGATETVMTATDRSNAGLGGFPDSPMGLFLHNGTNYVFGANSSNGSTQGFNSVDLNFLKTDLQLINITSPISKGGSNDFDANYAAVAIVYYDTATGILIGMEHGEYWYNPPSGSPFYSSLGLAYSNDFGVAWHKLGEVVTSQTARTNSCQADVGGGTLLNKGDGYLYVYYPDTSTGCGAFEMAVARAKISDVISAAQAGTLPAGNIFLKYFNGAFTEPGVTDRSNPAAGGGAFTPIFVTGGNAWFPNVAFDSAIQQYVMAYLQGWSGIGLRFSRDGINWSNATQIVNGNGNTPPYAVFYPTLVNTSGGDPNTLGSQFYVYYVDPFGNFSTSNLERVQITLSGSRPTPPTITGITVH